MPVLTTEEHQRLPVFHRIETHHGHDGDGVIASPVLGVRLAVQPGHGVVESGATGAVVPREAGEPVGAGCGELPARTLVVIGEDADAEPSGPAQLRLGARRARSADRDQPRFEGDRGDRVDDHADLALCRPR
jgi:hypothetical protein